MLNVVELTCELAKHKLQSFTFKIDVAEQGCARKGLCIAVATGLVSTQPSSDTSDRPRMHLLVHTRCFRAAPPD